MTCSYLEPLSFFGRFVQQANVSHFPDSFVQKATQQSDGNNNVTSYSWLINHLFEKQSFCSANTCEKNTVSKEYGFDLRDDKMCFLPNCRYQIIIVGYIKELLQKLDVSTTNTWTVCIHISGTDSVAKMLSRVDNSLIMHRGSSFQPPKQRS